MGQPMSKEVRPLNSASPWTGQFKQLFSLPARELLVTGDRSDGGGRVPRKGINIGSTGNRVDAYKGRKPAMPRKSTCRRMAKNKVISSRLCGQERSPVRRGIVSRRTVEYPARRKAWVGRHSAGGNTSGTVSQPVPVASQT